MRDARDYIASHCGGISGCGSLESSIHSDVFLSNSNQYCNCYSTLWNQRNDYPFNPVQIMYHETASCGSPHIHINTASFQNGSIRFDVDENADNAGHDCYYGEWRLLNQTPPVNIGRLAPRLLGVAQGSCTNP